nr:MAG TPA: hypothetical protein [Caudoviricetes sp.]
MAQALNEIHRIIRSLFAVLGIISHKSCRFVFSHCFTSCHKKSPPSVSFCIYEQQPRRAAGLV